MIVIDYTRYRVTTSTNFLMKGGVAKMKHIKLKRIQDHKIGEYGKV